MVTCQYEDPDDLPPDMLSPSCMLLVAIPPIIPTIPIEPTPQIPLANLPRKRLAARDVVRVALTTRMAVPLLAIEITLHALEDILDLSVGGLKYWRVTPDVLGAWIALWRHVCFLARQYRFKRACSTDHMGCRRGNFIRIVRSVRGG
ncbi:hypothetical protein M7I_8280 [Glarea lozoyensis 74030]|uniref:Uncharacterized protein n=1 Tax=Glarea lozoyensis (strain ATCC 74030 / MF5533) TaxID=1104152 RepID=H0EZK6_GLAL7|nr:hypothetical protein M7I_8280 [Glarea lozoyensis 74030]